MEFTNRNNKTPVKINGTTYNSIQHATDALGLSAHTVRRGIKKFVLPLSPMELKFHAKRFEKTGKKRFNEIEIIAEMVIFSGRYGSTNARNRKGELYHYTCKNLDIETGLCKIYDNRPSMCSEYPYKKKCEYKGCGFKKEET